MSERTDQRDRPKRGGGLAGVMNVRQEAFQAVEVIVGLLEEIKERVNPPDRGEAFAKVEVLTLGESSAGGGGQYVEVTKVIKIADKSTNARLTRIAMELPAQAFDTQSGGAWFWLGDSAQGVPLCQISIQGAQTGLVAQSSYEIPAGVPVDTITIRALTGLGGVSEMLGAPLRVAFFGEIPERD